MWKKYPLVSDSKSRGYIREKLARYLGGPSLTPSPVSKQIRAEIFDLLHKCVFTLRITSYGASFDMLGLSCFIAQKRSRSYGDLPVLKIEIWPPHPDRPIEMFHILYHLRMLRDELRAVPNIPKLGVWFLENDFVNGPKMARHGSR